MYYFAWRLVALQNVIYSLGDAYSDIFLFPRDIQISVEAAKYIAYK